MLCESLTYNTGVPEILKGERIHDHIKVYRPPFEEFEIQRMEVPSGEPVTIPTNPGPLILLVDRGAGSAQAAAATSLKGDGLQQQVELHRGSIVFVPAGTGLSFTASAAGALTIWAAACNAKVFAPASVPAAVGQEELVAEPALVAA